MASLYLKVIFWVTGRSVNTEAKAWAVCVLEIGFIGGARVGSLAWAPNRTIEAETPYPTRQRHHTLGTPRNTALKLTLATVIRAPLWVSESEINILSHEKIFWAEVWIPILALAFLKPQHYF